MSYEAGTSTGPNDLIDKLRIFLLAEGWTVNLFAAIGAGYRLHVQKTAADATVMYFNFRSAIAETGVTLITEDNEAGANGTVTGLLINGSTGYDVAEIWHHQPGKSVDATDKSFGCCMTAMSTSAIPAYYFFTPDADTVHIVVEVTAGSYQFMSFGMLVKQGTITGGMFFSASFASQKPAYDCGGWYAPNYFSACTAGNEHGAVYVNVDGTASWRTSTGSGTSKIQWPCVVGQQANEYYSKDGLASMFWAYSPNAYNAMAAMCPIYTLLLRTDNNYSLIGWPLGVRFLNVTNYDPAEELTYGAETWMVFPADMSQQTVGLNTKCGMAFLKVV
ncbi:MAG: hypothetical protein MUP16_00930 [Sedimentisphaerales bacterium]|nr:hypothetical protein [Sedimentisphaerales bacterium]